MKKLYRKSTVHPTPSVVSEQLLSFLPAVILTLTAALSPAEREVLAYLISCSTANFSNSNRKAAAPKTASASDHAPCFSCNCFRCYMSYWVKWDSSPNRQLIHEIIDAFEENLLKESRKDKNKKERRKAKNVVKGIGLNEPTKKLEVSLTEEELESNTAAALSGGGDVEETVAVDEEESEKGGSVRRFVSFLGERVWGVWG